MIFLSSWQRFGFLIIQNKKIPKIKKEEEEEGAAGGGGTWYQVPLGRRKGFFSLPSSRLRRRRDMIEEIFITVMCFDEKIKEKREENKKREA